MADNEIRQLIKSILAKFSGQSATLTIPRVYIEITGGIEPALLFSQIIYWSDRAKDGWFAKSYPEWQEEICLSEYQVRKAVKALEPFGVSTKLKKYNGAPTVHYHFDTDKFSEFIPKFFRNGKQSNFRNLDTKKTQETLTENKITNIDNPPNGSFTDLIKAWLDVSRSAQVNPYANKTNRKQAQALYEMGITADDVTAYCNELLAQPFWLQQGVKFDKVANGIGSWKEHRTRNGHETDTLISQWDTDNEPIREGVDYT